MNTLNDLFGMVAKITTPEYIHSSGFKASSNVGNILANRKDDTNTFWVPLKVITIDTMLSGR